MAMVRTPLRLWVDCFGGFLFRGFPFSRVSFFASLLMRRCAALEIIYFVDESSTPAPGLPTNTPRGFILHITTTLKHPYVLSLSVSPSKCFSDTSRYVGVISLGTGAIRTVIWVS